MSLPVGFRRRTGPSRGARAFDLVTDDLTDPHGLGGDFAALVLATELQRLLQCCLLYTSRCV